MELDQHPKTTYPEHLQDDSDFFTWRVVFEGPSDSLPGAWDHERIQRAEVDESIWCRPTVWTVKASRLQGFKA